MAKQQDDEFEEFEEDEEEEEVEEEDEPTLPKLPAKKKPEFKFQQQVKKAVTKPEVLQDEEEVQVQEPKVQYVPVPRAVSTESMLNELYDQNQQILQMIQQLLQK